MRQKARPTAAGTTSKWAPAISGCLQSPRWRVRTQERANGTGRARRGIWRCRKRQRRSAGGSTPGRCLWAASEPQSWWCSETERSRVPSGRWKIVRHHFSDAVEILDFYHASEHVWEIARSVFGEQNPAGERWAEKQCERLQKQGPDGLLRALRAL